MKEKEYRSTKLDKATGEFQDTGWIFGPDIGHFIYNRTISGKNIVNFEIVLITDYSKKMGRSASEKDISSDKDRQLMAIMFTDIVGYTAMMQQDERKGRTIRERHREIFTNLTRQHGGNILQYFGDGTLSVFKSSIHAVQCAMDIQKEAKQTPVIPLRIGIHVGDIIYSNEEAIGDSVNIASRIESIAEPGSIFISDKVYDDIKNQPEVKARFLGEFGFKNVQEKIGIHAIAGDGLAIPEQIHEEPGKKKRIRLPQRTRFPDHAIFIGRKEELELIHRSLKALEKHKPGVLIVSGIAGVGKSMLIRKSLADVNAVVIETRVFEDAATAFGPIISALRFLLNQVVPDRRGELALKDHLGLILPEYKKEHLETDNVTLTAAIQEVFQYTAKQVPVILLIEDIHWADTATLDLLPKLLDMPEDLPLFLLLTNRSDHLLKDKKIRVLRSELRRCKSYREIQIKPFDRDETANMLSLNLGKVPSGHFVEALYDRTFGLPLFVEETLNMLNTGNLLVESEGEVTLRPDTEIPLPDSINDTVAMQMDQLSSEAREILELAATIGMEFEFELLFEIDPNGSAIDELLDKQLVIEIRPGKGSFRHVLLLEAIRKDILWSKRKNLNKKVAQTLEVRQAAPDIVSEFWLRAGEKEKAREAYVEAAKHYCDIHAHHDAVKLADKALELWPKGKKEHDRIRVLLQYANCTKMSGQINASIMALREILESPLMAEKYHEQGNIYRSLATLYALKSQWHHYKKSREAAATANERADNWGEASVDWWDLASHYSDELNYSVSLKYIDRSLQCAKKSANMELQVRALSAKSYTLSLKGDVEKALKLANEALRMAQDHNLVEATAYAYRKLAGVLEYSSRFTESINAYQSTLAFCNREDLSLQSLFCLSCMSWVLFRLGDWTSAVETCKGVIADQEVNEASRSSAYLVIGLVEAYRGQLKSAYRAIEKSDQIAIKINYKLMILLNLWAKATIFEFDNRMEDSRLMYHQMISYWKESEDRHDILGGICAAVTFFSETREMEYLSECISICATIAEETGNPEAIAVLSYSLGMSALTSERWEEAELNLEKALKLFRELEIPLQVIMTECQLGRIYVCLKKREEGVILLKQANLAARKLGARPLASRIENILFDIGEVATDRRKAEHTTRQTYGGLTSRQYEILTALSEGMSNKEIASKLFLSTRTVDMHVRNIFNTLNCRNRADAVKVAVDLGILS